MATPSENVESIMAGKNRLAPIPLNIDQTGLSQGFLIDLVAKHLYSAGDLDQMALTQRTCLSWQVLEDLMVHLREGAFLELKRGLSGEIRYSLTEQGKNLALEAMVKTTYAGPAPVSLNQYTDVVRAQSVMNVSVNLQKMIDSYDDVVVSEELLAQVGAAVVSGRSMLVYGGPGTGKTYIAQRIARLLDGDILVPHAITVAEKIIKIFDPVIHEPVDEEDNESLILSERHDPRFVLCKRPAAITGGELTLKMLEINYDPDNKIYEAPTQLKANNGVYIVDDLGRQQIRPQDLLNRWIIPMEEKRDFHAVGGGTRFEVPSDIVLVFSTNLDPLELADEAFLRRLGYKIKFNNMNADDYEQVWRMNCVDRGLEFDPEVFRFVMEELYGKSDRPFVPCQPRDLIGLAMDQSRFQGLEPKLTKELLNWAWQSYFVQE
jgi:predicted ATPase with chaperone activity